MKIIKQKNPDIKITKKQVEKTPFKILKAPKPKNGRPHIGCGNGEWCGTPYCMGYC